MAARKQRVHPETVKERIKTSQLLNRLQQNALSDAEIMTPGQIRSAEILLRKTLPDLKSVENTGEVGVTIIRKTVYESKPE